MSGQETAREFDRVDLPALCRSLTLVFLALYVVSVPLKFHLGWLPVYVQLGLFVLFVMRVITGTGRFSLTRTQVVVLLVLALTVCVTIAGQLFGVSGRNLDKLPETTRFLVVALACVLELDSPRRIRQLLTVVMVTAAVVGLLSVINLFVPLPFARTAQVRSLGPISMPRSIGVLMAFGDFGLLALTGGAYAAMSVFRPGLIHGTDRGLGRALSALSLLFVLAGVFVGQSRSTLLAFAAVGVWGLLVAATHPDDRIRASIPTIPATILLLGTVAAGSNVTSMVQSLIDANTASVAVRLEQYRFALDLIVQRPIRGWGWQLFRTSLVDGITVHNLWLLLGVSLGIPVMILWLYLFARFGITYLRTAVSGRLAARPYAVIGVAMVLGGAIELLFYTGFTPGAAVLSGLLTGMLGLGRGHPEMD